MPCTSPRTKCVDRGGGTVRSPSAATGGVRSSCSSTTASTRAPFGSPPFHEPILWRHVSWGRQSPDREAKESSRWGWLFYRRVKTGKTFHRPMNRVVHTHIKAIMPSDPRPDAPVFRGGGVAPNSRFQELCALRE